VVVPREVVPLVEVPLVEFPLVEVPLVEVRLVEAVQAVHRIHSTQKPLQIGGAFFI